LLLKNERQNKTQTLQGYLSQRQEKSWPKANIKKKVGGAGRNTTYHMLAYTRAIAGFHYHTIIKTIKQIQSRIKEINLKRR